MCITVYNFFYQSYRHYTYILLKEKCESLDKYYDVNAKHYACSLSLYLSDIWKQKRYEEKSGLVFPMFLETKCTTFSRTMQKGNRLGKT